MDQSWRRQWFQSGLGFLGGVAIAVPVTAQIVPDTSLPTNSIVIPNCTICIIDGGTPSGTNLFHSFAQFSVPTGGAALFNNAAQIQNIFARVTGNLESNINGLIYANPSANLFLMNPNGIIFGPNARLNVGGSFAATTANAIQFGDRGFFSATNPTAPPLLTINPSALVFNSASPGAIVNRSTTPLGATPGGFDLKGLQVPNGQSLALVGGEVRLAGGGITVPGGRVELGGLAAPGTVGLDVQPDGLRLQFPSEIPLANVALTDMALISVASNGGGAVTINARNLDLLGSSVIRSGIETGAIAPRPAGDIVINATQSVRLDGSNTEINNNNRPNSVGDTGAIRINTGTLSLTNGAVLRNVIFGLGNSGAIAINARDAVLFDASFLGMGSAPGGIGNGGTVTITTGSLALRNGAEFDTSSAGQGNGGAIIVQATGAVDFSGPRLSRFSSGIARNAVGIGGDITITAKSLSLRNGFLSTNVGGTDRNGQGTPGRGNAGNITLNILGAVSIDGTDESPTGMVSTLGFGAVGNAGKIALNAKSLSLQQGVVDSGAFGVGNAGNIEMRVAGGITLSNQSYIGNSVVTPLGLATAVGDSGEIRIQASTLTATDSFIASQSTGQGNAGNQFITVDILQLNNSLIGASPNDGGNAGNIQIDARDAVILQGNKAFIGTPLLSGTGRAGDITINTGTLSLVDTEGAGINSITNGLGDAGTITLNARDLILINNSTVISSVNLGAQGRGGDIRIRAGSVALVNGGNLNAITQGQGNAGTIILEVNDTLSIAGNSPKLGNSGIFNNVQQPGSGNGGNIQILIGTLTMGRNSGISSSTLGAGNGNAGNIRITATGPVSITNANSSNSSVPSGIYVVSQTNGSTGNITLTAPRLILSDQGTINADSNAVNGGNITLNLGELLLLRRGGTISTTAGTAQAGGDGGNIIINVPRGFIVAVLAENSDITANAFSGNGGRVNITAQGIYGIQFQTRLTPFSDITASSTLGINGVVNLATPDVDPSRGLVPLPVALVDPANKIDQRCAPRGPQRASSFVVTGTGGIPTSPVDPLVQQGTLMELVPLPQDKTQANGGGQAGAEGDRPRVVQEVGLAQESGIVEAQGWRVDNQGVVWLVADAGAGGPPRPEIADCSRYLATGK
jgi:filamentous hemagglutinin family protein